MAPARPRDPDTMRSPHFPALSTLLVAALLPLAGCGWLTSDDGMFRDRGEDYRRARLDAPLELPGDVNATAMDDALAIPSGGDHHPLSGAFEVPRPEPLDGDPSADLVRIQSLGGERWLLVDIDPGEVWPRVRQFLLNSQLAVGRIDATAGLIETVWLQPQDGGRERYRFRIEQGVQRGSSEVFVLQQAGGGDSWPARSGNDAREAEMVRALAQFIADSGASGAVSMLAQRGLASAGKVSLVRGNTPALKLQLAGDRAWASLDLALPKAGFAVEDRNQQQSQFWVRYAPSDEEQEEKGWFDWLFGSDDDLFEDDKTVYLVTMAEAEAEAGAVLIRIRREDGQPLPVADAERLLQQLKGHLS